MHVQPITRQQTSPGQIDQRQQVLDSGAKVIAALLLLADRAAGRQTLFDDAQSGRDGSVEGHNEIELQLVLEVALLTCSAVMCTGVL